MITTIKLHPLDFHDSRFQEGRQLDDIAFRELRLERLESRQWKLAISLIYIQIVGEMRDGIQKNTEHKGSHTL